MPKDLETLVSDTRKLRSAVQASKAINVNKASLRTNARKLVQDYFREVRPAVHSYLSEPQIAALDGSFQKLLGLANGSNAKSSYNNVLKEVISAVDASHFEAVKVRSDHEAKRRAATSMTNVEQQIFNTLLRMLPSAANAYRQAISDLHADRFSYRGPAIDLRETLREVLDHMATDDAVMKSPGFKLERDAKHPTMAQKARYIMKQREYTDSVARPSVDAAGIVEAMTAKWVRSIYVSGSVSVHVAPSRGDVQQLKLHVDSALAQLLGIFA